MPDLKEILRDKVKEALAAGAQKIPTTGVGSTQKIEVEEKGNWLSLTKTVIICVTVLIIFLNMVPYLGMLFEMLAGVLE